MQKDWILNLRFAAWCFLVTGLAGLIIASEISLTYVEHLPKLPDPQMMRMTPREITGITVYQTETEDRRLDIVEYSSTIVLLIGLGLSLVYLRRWGIARAIQGEEGDREYSEG
jgi:hypothetical protein